MRTDGDFFFLFFYGGDQIGKYAFAGVAVETGKRAIYGQRRQLEIGRIGTHAAYAQLCEQTTVGALASKIDRKLGTDVFADVEHARENVVAVHAQIFIAVEDEMVVHCDIG